MVPLEITCFCYFVADSVLVVKARQPKPFFAAGNTFEMTCKVSSKNIKSPRYSVLITAEKPVGDLSSPNETKYIISLDQDSVVKLENWTDASRVDGVVLEKVQEDEFRYRMYQTQVSDAGLYRCVVTAWSPVRGSLWREAATSLSNPIEIDFQTSGEQRTLCRHRGSYERPWGLDPVALFFLTALLRYDSYVIRSTHLKYVVRA